MMKFIVHILRFSRRIFRSTRLQHNVFLIAIYTFLIRRILNTSEEPILFRHFSIYTDPEDISITPSVVTGDFEKLELDYLEQYLQIDDGPFLFIDIGANIGIYTIFISKILGNSVKIIAIEPNLKSAQILSQNLKLNKVDLDYIEIKSFAIGLVEKKYFFTNQSNAGASSLTLDPKEGDPIEIQTLGYFKEDFENSYFKQILIKVDIEGYEADALLSDFELVKNCRVTILMEFFNEPNRLKLGDFEMLFSLLSTIYSSCLIFREDQVFEIAVEDLWNNLISDNHLSNILFLNENRIKTNAID
jgi:FkbM family methyltransferase